MPKGADPIKWPEPDNGCPEWPSPRQLVPCKSRPEPEGPEPDNGCLKWPEPWAAGALQVKTGSEAADAESERAAPLKTLTAQVGVPGVWLKLHPVEVTNLGLIPNGDGDNEWTLNVPFMVQCPTLSP